MAVIEITGENFKQEVSEYKGTVLLDFWAAWCGPCRTLSPLVDEVAEERKDIKVGKVNVDGQGDLAMRFQITNIPTLVVFRNGKPVNRSVGVISKEEILGLFL